MVLGFCAKVIERRQTLFVKFIVQAMLFDHPRFAIGTLVAFASSLSDRGVLLTRSLRLT
jgi:hypothetical protein